MAEQKRRGRRAAAQQSNNTETDATVSAIDNGETIHEPPVETKKVQREPVFYKTKPYQEIHGGPLEGHYIQGDNLFTPGGVYKGKA